MEKEPLPKVTKIKATPESVLKSFDIGDSGVHANFTRNAITIHHSSKSRKSKTPLHQLNGKKPNFFSVWEDTRYRAYSQNYQHSKGEFSKSWSRRGRKGESSNQLSKSGHTGLVNGKNIDEFSSKEKVLL
jgi:hypothetical protein